MAQSTEKEEIMAESVVREVQSALQHLSPDKRLEILQDGVFLDQMRKKYWVEKSTGSKCFMLYARNLSITWGDDRRYWRWVNMKETNSEVFVQVAELLDVCWLEIRGQFDASNLSTKSKYEVAFVVKLNPNHYGWDNPVKLKLELPNGQTQESQVDLQSIPLGEWTELRVGKFRTSDDNNIGNVKFSLCGSEGLIWKKGLVMKGVIFRPKIRKRRRHCP